MLTGLPDALDREAVRRIATGAIAGPDAAVSALLVVMVWGYGRVGYAVSRATQALVTPQAGEMVFEAAVAVRDVGAVAGYKSLKARHPRQVGTAFGTKFLALSSTRTEAPPLILDRLVSRWLAREASVLINAERWSAPKYDQYLVTMYAWADALSVPAESVELCIFRDESQRDGNQWSGR